MKNLFKAYREWRDKKFIERIDRVYFNKDKDENLYIKGNVVVEGNISCYRNTSEANEIDVLKAKSPVSKKKSK